MLFLILKEKNFSTNNLPPFEDDTNKTNLFLDKFDTILVSNNFKNERMGMAASVNLRYRLHLKNYLEKILVILLFQKLMDMD